jgi:probable rRNA maturation factor
MISPDAPMLPLVEVITESNLWNAEAGADTVIRDAIAVAAQRTHTAAGEVSVLLTDDESIRVLNRTWRKLDQPTDVLSFPAPKLGGPGPTGVPLGDIVIAFETTAGEAAAERKPFRHHLAHLAVHGFLHLLGYDHESDGDAREMEELETSILVDLHVPDPYGT